MVPYNWILTKFDQELLTSSRHPTRQWTVTIVFASFLLQNVTNADNSYLNHDTIPSFIIDWRHDVTTTSVAALNYILLKKVHRFEMLFVRRHTQLRTKSSTANRNSFWDRARLSYKQRRQGSWQHWWLLVNEQTSTDVEHNTNFTRTFWRQHLTKGFLCSI